MAVKRLSNGSRYTHIFQAVKRPVKRLKIYADLNGCQTIVILFFAKFVELKLTNWR